MKHYFFTVVLLVLAVTADVHAQRCGVERWPVKTGTDRDISRVDLDNPQTVTIRDLQQLNGGRPFTKRTLRRRRTTRIRPDELRTFTLDANLIAYKREGGPTGDSDFHLVLQDNSCPRRRRASCMVVVEIPIASCVATVSNPGSNRQRVLDGITQARRDFEAFVERDKPANLNINERFRVTNVPVRVFGIGFYDFSHGQRGRAPNIFEIHPVLRIEFR
ncbi:MAG: hypothetical protein ICV60_04435 [Pyrinomonadaceae bacterium]|nr:hypothetical protein [Pyrinomonadaceae bacterium]